MLIGLAILAGIAVVVAANWAPDEHIGSVSAPELDADLVGGGLSSKQLGSDLLLASLSSADTIGYQILQDGVDEGVIDNFKQVTPSSGFVTEFNLNGSDLRLRFRGPGRMLLNYPLSQRDVANELFAIAGRYGFLAAFNDRSLTVGVPEVDLVSQADSLIADWDSWISEVGDSPEVPVAQARRDVVALAREVSSNPTNPGIDDFNDGVDDLNAAVRAYNQGR